MYTAYVYIYICIYIYIQRYRIISDDISPCLMPEQPKKKHRRAGGGRNWFAGWSFLAHHGGDALLGSLGEAGHGGHGVGAR